MNGLYLQCSCGGLRGSSSRVGEELPMTCDFIIRQYQVQGDCIQCHCIR